MTLRTDAERAAFVLANTQIGHHPLVPELQLRLADAASPLWQVTMDWLDDREIGLPFWAFVWPGGAGLARWLLDHPEAVAGRAVLDLGCGGGLVALAATRAGARSTLANDVDPLALAAAAANAALNGLALTPLLADLTAGEGVSAEVILLGDLWYDAPLALRLLPWLRQQARTRRVLYAEPGRRYAPRSGTHTLASVPVPVTQDLESRDTMETVIVELLAD